MIRREDNFDLTGRNSFKMKVSCSCLVEYDSPEDLEEIDFKNLPQPVLHIGGGSNLLFTGDFKGTVIHSGIKYYKVIASAEEEVLVEVGAGVIFDDFCAWASDNGLWGVENLSGIPGEVGASAVQNIGAYGVEVKDVIAQVKCFDMKERRIVTFSNAQCAYAYRDSAFKHSPVKGRYAVLSVLFRLSKEYSPKLEYGNVRSALPQKAFYGPSDIRRAILGIRSAKLPDPEHLGNAGSFFKNPIVDMETFGRISGVAEEMHGEGYEVPHFVLADGMVKVPAAWMIEQCGMKGWRDAKAGVYEKQPLVIVNLSGDAAPQDILAVENRIKDEVRSRFGVDLQAEVEHI